MCESVSGDCEQKAPIFSDRCDHGLHAASLERHPTCSRGGRGHIYGSLQGGSSQLEARDGKGSSRIWYSGGTRGRSLARKWLWCWLMAFSTVNGREISGEPISIPQFAAAFEQAGRVCRDDCDWNLCGSSQMRQASKDCGGSMPPSNGSTVWSAEYSSTRGVVPRVSCSLEGCQHNPKDIEGISKFAGDATVHVGVCANVKASSLGTLSISDYDVSSPRGEVRVRISCEEVDCEEGRTHKGEAFLQVPSSSVRIFPMGSSGETGNPDDLQGGHCGELGNDFGRDRGVQRRATEEEEAGSRGAEAEGGASREGEGLERKGCHHQPNPGGSQDGDRSFSGGDGPAAESSDRSRATPPSPSAVSSRSSAVDECRGRRGANEQGDERSHIPSGDGRAGHGSQEYDGGAEGAGKCMREETRTAGKPGWEELAPWMCPIRGQAQWNTALKVQLRDEVKAGRDRVFADGYWAKEEGGKMEFYQGILPVQNEFEEVFLQVSKGVDGEDFMDEIEGPLRKGYRKRIQRAMKLVEEKMPKIAEVYSEPRISQKAEEMGCPNGRAFDLKNGYDFSRRKDQLRCWQELEEYDPDVIVICPPCGPFSPLQEWNYARMPTNKAVLILGEGVGHLEFAIKVFEWQVRRGKWALFKHPLASRAWQENSVQRCMNLPGAEKISADQCQFGLRVKNAEDLNKKPTGFMGNSPQILSRLMRHCEGGHAHQPLLHGRARRAEVYPPRLCRAVVQGSIEEVNQSQLVFLGEEEAVENADGAGEDDEAIDGEEELRRLKVAEEDPNGELEEVSERVPCALNRKEKQLIQKVHVNLGHPSKADFVRVMKMARARSEVMHGVHPAGVQMPTMRATSEAESGKTSSGAAHV